MDGASRITGIVLVDAALIGLSFIYRINAQNKEPTMAWRDYIDRNPDILAGKPKIRGTRIGVELILERLGDGWSIEQLLEFYPSITAEQIHACQSYAAEMLATDDVVDIPTSAA